jgi:hypothetical protein
MIATRVPTLIATIAGQRKRKHQAKSNKVGQIAKPWPQLNEETKPAPIIISIINQDRDAFLTKTKQSAAAAVVREFSELNPPKQVIDSRPIQKLPTITIIVAMIFVVRPVV